MKKTKNQYKKKYDKKSLRILMISATWLGASDYAMLRALRRKGHSVTVVSTEGFIPNWQHKGLRILKRLLKPFFVADYNRAILQAASELHPDLFFVFKGPFITPQTINALKTKGTISINFYPDVSFKTHGPYLPKAMPHYDWIFTTKTFGIDDMANQLNIRNSSFLPHGYDPECHIPAKLRSRELEMYSCDVSFIGNWSPKKQSILEKLKHDLPNIDLRIWGPNTWNQAKSLRDIYQGVPLKGLEYARAISASRINLGILSEVREGASNGDQSTTRTFEIPAVGGFMLHEKTPEAVQYFDENKECAFYSDNDDLVNKIKYYLELPNERTAIATAGYERSIKSGYSVDRRVKVILAKYFELLK